MPNHLALFLAGATMVIGGVPAFAYGSAASHSSSSAVGRASTAARSIGSASTRLSPSTRFQSQAPLTRFGSSTTPTRFSSTTTTKMFVLTAPGVLTKATPAPTTATAADPPPPDPPAPSATVTTSTGTLGGGGQGSSVNLSQFNTGAQDVATPAVSPPISTDITSVSSSGSSLLLGANGLELAAPAVSAPLTTASATTTTIGASILNLENLMLPNTATSGAVPQAPVSAAILAPTAAIVGTTGEVIATSGGSSLKEGGATGRNMPECMGAWDKATHIAKTKWREICARTLTQEHMY